MVQEKITLSVIKADIGGWVGHSRTHPILETCAREALAQPHRLPLEAMEYTTMPKVMERFESRFVRV